MRVRWTPSATGDLESIVNFIRIDDIEASYRIARKLYSAAESLSSMPRRGRVGQMEGTRELVLPRLPYIIVYQVLELISESSEFGTPRGNGRQAEDTTAHLADTCDKVL